MWNSARQMLGLQTKIGPLAAIAAILVGFVFSAIVPLFYLALYRNQGELPISRNMRWMAMIAAVAIGILTLSSIPEWIGSWRGESVVNAAARQWTIGDTAVLLGMIADFAGILLLAALYRLADDGSSGSGIGVSRLFRSLTKIAVIVGGIVAIGGLIGLAATPWVYFYIRDRSLETGSSIDGWTLSHLTLERLRSTLKVISVYVAPFVVWQGTRTRGTGTQDNAGSL